MSVVVEVTRGALVESAHDVLVAVADASGALRAWAGDARRAVFARSSVKPFQALPLLIDGAAERLALSDAELAVCCASHNAEERHLELVRAILGRLGAGEEALACGPHTPMGAAAASALAARGEEPTRIHNNCSGKHAGMLALASVHGWPLAGYHLRTHPVQRRVLDEIGRWTGLPAEQIDTAVDGCGVPTFALPLDALAGAFARLAAAARRGEGDPARVVNAMVRNPELVAGTGRLCTDLMRAAGGRILAKVGAEGVYCAAVPGAELGIALKVEDGATRAAGPALVGVLAALQLLTPDEQAALEQHAAPLVRNTRGEAVGALSARVQLEVA